MNDNRTEPRRPQAGDDVMVRNPQGQLAGVEIATLRFDTDHCVTFAIGNRAEASRRMTFDDTCDYWRRVVQHGVANVRLAGYVLLREEWGWDGEKLTNEVVPHPLRCEICVAGCDCTVGSTGCGHHGCWWADATTANTCPGVTAVG